MYRIFFFSSILLAVILSPFDPVAAVAASTATRASTVATSTLRIANFKIGFAPISSQSDRVQAVVSWTTTQPTTGVVSYIEGAYSNVPNLPYTVTTPAEFTTTHSIIVPNIKSGTVYTIKIDATARKGDSTSFGPRSIASPRTQTSVLDILIIHIRETFGFLRGII